MAKYRITPSSKAIIQLPISIGHKAEKGVEAIEFDVTAWVETYGSGTLTVIMRRWGDAIPYPIALEIDENNKATWTLSDIDTAKAGMAYAQLSYIVGDEVVKKSDIYTFRVMDSLTGEGDPPEAYESWLEHLQRLAAEAMAEALDIEGVATDKTLTVDGGIADAKATGDALALKADKSTTYTKTEVDQMIEDVEVETDTTLAIPGAPADAKKVGDELSDIKADLDAQAVDIIPNILITEQGALRAADGILIDATNRIRTVNKIYGSMSITCPTGIKVYRAIYYNVSDDSYNSYAEINAQKADINVPTGTYVKLVFTKDNGTDALTPGEFQIVGTVNEMHNRIKYLESDSEMTKTESCIVENGAFNVAGVPVDSTIRLRTVNKFLHSTKIKCIDGVIVFRVFYFNSADNSFNSFIEPRSQEAVINLPTGTYAKVVFSKTDTNATIIPGEFKTINTAEYLNQKIDDSAGEVLAEILCVESGSLRLSDGLEVDRDTRLRTVSKIYKSTYIKCPDGFKIYAVIYFNVADDTYNSYEQLGTQSAKLALPTGTYARLVFAKADDTQTITVKEFTAINTDEFFNDKINALESVNVPPMVEFTYDHTMHDCTAIVVEKGYSAGSTSIENIYSYFDELLTAHGDYITKVDAAQEIGLAYPTYANGISGDQVYQDTPAYKTYMYRFVSTNANVNPVNNPKKKLLLIGATHGDEQASPFNLYIFAKRLCEDYLSDDNLFKLRSAYDIYIIPCLNGYGMYHVQRANANGVDINRNYPIKKWAVADIGNTHYTGPSAGSEFETQLVMGIINSIKPTMLIDHHNYAHNLAWQFYAEINTPEQIKLCYQSAVDCSFAFKKAYPQYFGSDCGFVIDRTGGAPGTIAPDTHGTTSRYGYEVGIPFAGTVEISQCINYVNGVHANVATDLFGADTFSIAEYTLRNQLLRYGEWALKHS